MSGPLRQAWEDQADAWAAWSRAPKHDAFWHHTLPHLLELLPEPGPLTLDLGSGEGRLARELTARGHRVLGVDSSPTLARMATTVPSPLPPSSPTSPPSLSATAPRTSPSPACRSRTSTTSRAQGTKPPAHWSPVDGSG